MIHGADLLTYSEDGDLIDFSSNINSLGPAPGLEDFLWSERHRLSAYPDIQYRELRKAVAEYLGVSSDLILLGNGSVELIDLIISAHRKLLVPVPSFGEYELRAKVHGLDIQFLKSSEDLSIDEDRVLELMNKSEPDTALILANPNNPTGLALEKDFLYRIFKLAAKGSASVILDEAFFEFANLDYDTVDLARAFDFKNIYLLRASTKFFGLPGLRLGYGLTQKPVAKLLRERQLPWNINSFAESAGRYIFNCKSYIDQSIKLNISLRNDFVNGLEKLGAFNIYPSRSNYLLLKLKKGTVDDLFDFLLERKILIRTCSSFRGLDPNHLRIAVRSKEDNDYLLKQLEAYYGK